MLTKIIEEIAEPLRNRIGAFWIERDDAAGWRVRIDYTLMVAAYPGEEAEAGPHRITADLGALPDGVHARALVRYPNSMHPIEVLGDDPDPHIEHMIRALDASGILGRLDWRDHGGRWLVKTHAGSDAERAAWLRSLS